jgi:hypothetical protein
MSSIYVLPGVPARGHTEMKAPAPERLPSFGGTTDDAGRIHESSRSARDTHDGGAVGAHESEGAILRNPAGARPQ